MAHAAQHSRRAPRAPCTTLKPLPRACAPPLGCTSAASRLHLDCISVVQVEAINDREFFLRAVREAEAKLEALSAERGGLLDELRGLLTKAV